MQNRSTERVAPTRDEMVEIWNGLETRLGLHPKFAQTFACFDEEADGVYLLLSPFSEFLNSLIRSGDSSSQITACIDFINELVARENSLVNGALLIDVFEMLALSKSQDEHFKSALSPRALELFQGTWHVMK